MEKNYKEVQTKISIPIYRRLRRVLDKIGVTLYALIQNFIDVIIRFCDDRHNLTPETDALMSAFEGAEGWDKQFNLADFTTSPEIAEATYYLRDHDKKGVRVVHVERPFFGQWTQTFNVKQILEKFLCLTFPHLYKRLRFIAVCRDCNSILELLYSLVNDLESEENRREFRKPFEDAERSEWGRYINQPRYKIKHRHTVDEMDSPDLFAGDHDSFIENENEQ